MALKSYNYKPYRSRRKRRNRKVLTGFILLITIIVIIVVLKSCNGSDENSADNVSLQDNTTTSQNTDKAKAAEPKRRNKIQLPKKNTKAKTDTIKKCPAKSLQPQPAKQQQQHNVIKSQDKDTIAKLKKIEAQARKYINNKEIIAARDLLNDTLKMSLTARQRNDIKNTLASLANKWLFSNEVLPDDRICSYYKVKPGQVPSQIGKKYKVPWRFLLKINNIDKPERLWAGTKMKVIKGPFNAKIYRSTFTMDVFVQGMYVKSYKVGLGKIGENGNPTPLGLWKVKSRGKGKLVRPPWPEPRTGKLVYYEDKDYPLGERWIGLDGVDGQAKGRTGFGIHGTNKPESIGKFASDGCIRMHNNSVIEFFDMVNEGLTQIQVVD